MTGEERRKRILDLLDDTSRPLSGSKLAELCGVSRQVIVQDIALLRSSGAEVASTSRGYALMRADGRARRLFKVRHTDEQIADELNAIVDLGATVDDVVVNHRAYGRISAKLGLSSRREVTAYLNDLAESMSTPLMHVTSGYHFHHVSAESEEVLDEVGEALQELGFLVERLPYEEGMA